MTATNWDPVKEEAYLRALGPLMQECFSEVRRRLPEGTDFGILIRVRGQPEGRVIAATTDRERVAWFGAQWALNILREGE